MSKLHNFPQAEVGHLSILSGPFAGTVTKTFDCLAGQYTIAVAYACASVSAASTVQVHPFANLEQTAVGTAYDMRVPGGTYDGTVTIATGTNAQVEFSAADIFAPFGFRVTFSTTRPGTGSIDFFARTKG